MISRMDRLDTTLYFVSAVLQLAAMVFAVRMSKEVADRRPWLMLFAALAVMFGARILALSVPLQIRQHLGPFIAVVISLLLLVALFAIRRVAIAERLSRLSAATSAAALSKPARRADVRSDRASAPAITRDASAPSGRKSGAMNASINVSYPSTMATRNPTVATTCERRFASTPNVRLVIAQHCASTLRMPHVVIVPFDDEFGPRAGRWVHAHLRLCCRERRRANCFSTR